MVVSRASNGTGINSQYDRCSRSGKRRRLSPELMGQFSYSAPVETTTITTTKTVTTHLPIFPLPLPLPHDEYNDKNYPLANAQTPPELRRISFPSGDGRTVTYEEIRNVPQRYNPRRMRRPSPQEHNKTTLSQGREATTPSSITPGASPSPSGQLMHELDQDDGSGVVDVDTDAALPPAQLIPNGKRRKGKHPQAQPQSGIRPFTSISHPHPSSSAGPFNQRRHMHSTRTLMPPAAHGTDEATSLPLTPTINQRTRDGNPCTNPVSTSFCSQTTRPLSRNSRDSAVPTPPIEPSDASALVHALSTQALSSIPTRLHTSRSSSEPDVTLPSPSPSSAGSYSNTEGEYFDEADAFTQDLNLRTFDGPHGSRFHRGISHGTYDSPALTEVEDSDDEELAPPQSVPGAKDLSSMMSLFDTLPDNMKKVVLHMLLRRCSKPILQFVADTVNPALKCDPMHKLPAELALKIISHLDVQTMCRAAQVNRKWREIINTEDRLWKRLFEADGFQLAEGEEEVAIRQGWGWQDPHGIEGREQDMSGSINAVSNIFDREAGPSEYKATVLRRSKRKATTELFGCKYLKRQITSREASVDLEMTDATNSVSVSTQAFNLKDRAESAVPDPHLSLPSLKCMHLYKSLYRRHHQIKRNWFTEEAKPHHIAFRAHTNHVVTCLQFDPDKILTGSDDNNINVYDTKTGRLRALLKGHDGGVWALQYLNNQLVSGGTDRSVRVWDIERGIETHRFRGHTSTVRCLQIVMPAKIGEDGEGRDIVMPETPLIITGSRDSTLRIWHLPSVNSPGHIEPENDENHDHAPFFVRRLDGHTHSVRALAAHGDTLVSGSYDNTVRVWKISTGETVHRFDGHSAKVYSVVLDYDRGRCISGSMDYLVKIWDLKTGNALYTLEGHQSLVGLLDLNSERLVSAAADSTLRIWDAENGACKAILTAHTGAITCFQHDNQKVISGSERTLKMWDIKTGQMTRDLLSDLSGVWQVKFNDRRCVAAVQRDNTTFIEVLDFGAARDGVPARDRGRRIEVDAHGWTPSPEQNAGENADHEAQRWIKSR